MKLELGIMAGPESKAFLVDLTKLVERMEKAVSAKPAKAKASEETEADEEEDESEEEDEDFGAKKTKSKKGASSFDEDEATDDDDTSEEEEEEEEESEEEEDEEEEEEKPKKKAKKLTIDDVNDACKLRAKGKGEKGRNEVLAILKKNFKTSSVTGLKPEQYAKAIAAMQK